MQLLNTLYVTTQEAWLRLDNDTLRVVVDDATRLRVPLHHLEAVVCLGRIGLSVPLMHRLAEEGIALVLLDEHGRFKARLEGAVSGNVLLRHAQHHVAVNLGFALATARACVAGKIKNARHVLQRGARDATAANDASALTDAAQALAASLRTLPTASTLDEVRGIEGEAARQYFAAQPHLVRPDRREHFAMQGRTRRPPRDPANALMSFIYTLWMNDCRSALEAVGLDPQVGFLHAMRPGRAALALDLMEEFRPLAERLALTLINRGQLTMGDFDRQAGGAVYLSPEPRKQVLAAYQARKQDTLGHPLLAETVPVGLLPMVQARLMARAVRAWGTATQDAHAYLPFIMK